MRNGYRPAVLLLFLVLTLSAACSPATGSANREAPTASAATSVAPGSYAAPGSASAPSGDSGAGGSAVSSTSRQTAITVIAPTDLPTSSTPPPAVSPISGTATAAAIATTARTAPTAPTPTAPTPTAPTPTAPTPTAPTPTPPTSTAVPAASTTVTPAATSRTAKPSPTTRPSTSGSLAGKVVVIDPGHNGRNSEHPEIINKLVPAGFGKTKACNTTGTQTNAGFPEYRFNWLTAQYLNADLAAAGATVVMTRDSDDGVGPCVNIRAKIGNDAKADAVISIHGDGASAGIRGFYVMTSEQKPAGDAIFARSLDLATAIRNGLAGQGLPQSNALGRNGLWTRSDLAGLNLSVRPTVMIECGNMRNSTEAALMSSAAGQREYARGIADGVIAYLAH